MPTKRQKRTRNRRWAGIVVFLLLLIGAGLVIFAVVREVNNDSELVESERRSREINYEAPSDEEVAAGEDIKKEGEAETGDNENVGKNGEVFIVDANQYGSEVEVRARIDGVVEDGKQCTYKFTKGTVSITKIQNASANAKNTSCGTLIVSIDEFEQSGEWSVSVSYGGAVQASAKLEIAK